MGLKTLANCKPSEFLRQTNLIRKSVEKWLTVTDIMNIRKRIPENPEDKDARAEQAKSNISAILDAILEEHPDETLEVLALCCFVDPKDADTHTVAEYLEAFTGLMTNKAVIGFFSSLMRLGRTDT